MWGIEQEGRVLLGACWIGHGGSGEVEIWWISAAVVSAARNEADAIFAYECQLYLTL
jgi:hypothetical protein